LQGDNGSWAMRLGNLVCAIQYENSFCYRSGWLKREGTANRL
jgi:hypothetical protein